MEILLVLPKPPPDAARRRVPQPDRGAGYLPRIDAENLRDRTARGFQPARTSAPAIRDQMLHLVFITRSAGIVLSPWACSSRARSSCSSAGLADDWIRIGDEAGALLAELIRVDTTNPPGGETAAANVTGAELRSEGSPPTCSSRRLVAATCTRASPEPAAGGRSSCSRIWTSCPPTHGAGACRPSAACARRDYLYGRGALDAKGVAAVQAMALIASSAPGARSPAT